MNKDLTRLGTMLRQMQWQPLRPVETRSDFGPGCGGWCVRRRDINHDDTGKIENIAEYYATAYGVYLGSHVEGYVVGVKHFCSPRLDAMITGRVDTSGDGMREVIAALLCESSQLITLDRLQGFLAYEAFGDLREVWELD